VIYGIYYWLSRLSLDSFASVVLYFGYLTILALVTFIVTGPSFVTFLIHTDAGHDRYHWFLGFCVGRSSTLFRRSNRLNWFERTLVTQYLIQITKYYIDLSNLIR